MSCYTGDDASVLSPAASSAHRMMWGDSSTQADPEAWHGDSSPSGPDFTLEANYNLDELHLESPSPVGFAVGFRKSADVKILRHPRPQRPGPLDTAISVLNVDDSTGPATTCISPQRSGFSFQSDVTSNLNTSASNGTLYSSHLSGATSNAIEGKPVADLTTFQSSISSPLDNQGNSPLSDNYSSGPSSQNISVSSTQLPESEWNYGTRSPIYVGLSPDWNPASVLALTTAPSYLYDSGRSSQDFTEFSQGAASTSTLGRSEPTDLASTRPDPSSLRATSVDALVDSGFSKGPDLTGRAPSVSWGSETDFVSRKPSTS